ncbi:MAG: nitroreductase family protein [Rikenellaceae bacterium]|nr:nitroreductase family protein [Rikenellaceae bacterium]
MQRNFMEAVALRRSIYHLDAEIAATDKQITRIIEHALRYVPSAFNSQSTRIVLLVRHHHKRLWEIVKECLAPRLTPEQQQRTFQKIDAEFAVGHGTILFYEDSEVVAGQRAAYPSYADKMDTWAEHTSAMHQFVVWTALADLGIGASLQHYNPLIDHRLVEEWGLSESWRLIAQMPFGGRLSEPVEREQHTPIYERLRVFD